MKTRDIDTIPDDFDWSATTFEGTRREQLRRWAKLPLEDVIRSLEEMDELAQALHPLRASTENRKGGTSAGSADSRRDLGSTR
jgi:hypothetical protein